MIRQTSPGDEERFIDHMQGGYGKQEGVWPKARRIMQEEIQYGTKMDLDRVNAAIRASIQEGVDRYVRPQTDIQRAAVRASMQQINRGVTADDVFPEIQ